jgi:hypothetical protein
MSSLFFLASAHPARRGIHHFKADRVLDSARACFFGANSYALQEFGDEYLSIANASVGMSGRTENGVARCFDKFIVAGYVQTYLWYQIWYYRLASVDFAFVLMLSVSGAAAYGYSCDFGGEKSFPHSVESVGLDY